MRGSKKTSYLFPVSSSEAKRSSAQRECQVLVDFFYLSNTEELYLI